MNRFAHVVVAATLAIALLAWGAVWWVTRDPQLSESASVGTATTAGSTATAPHDSGQRGAIATPPALREQTTATAPQPLPPVVDNSTASSKPFKPQVEPSSPPLPSPIKPNSEGVVDLSSEPNTKAFADALQQGYARRSTEVVRGQRDAPAPGP